MAAKTVPDRESPEKIAIVQLLSFRDLVGTVAEPGHSGRKDAIGRLERGHLPLIFAVQGDGRIPLHPVGVMGVTSHSRAGRREQPDRGRDESSSEPGLFSDRGEKAGKGD